MLESLDLMLCALARLLRVALLSLGFVACAAALASAAIERPNALDRRVDALPARTLLSAPAATLVDPPRQAAAQRRMRWTLPGFVATALFQAIALLYFWRSGLGARLRDALRRTLHSESAARFCFGAALGGIARLAGLIPAFYLYRVERAFNLSFELTRTWMAFYLVHSLMAMVVAGLIAAIVLWLVDRTHQWYLLTAAAIVIVCIAWSYASPYFVLPGARIEVPPAVADRLHPLLVRAGEPSLPIVLDDRSEVETAVVQGLGASRRVAISQVLLAADTPGEIDFAVALSLGHINHDDQLRGALILAAIVIVAATLAVAIADRIRFRRDDDSLSRLALVGALMAVVYLFAVPVRNATLRTLDLGADRYAVALTRDPASGVRLAVRVADQRMDEICPEALPQLMLAVHPSPSERIAAIAGSPSGCP